MSARVEALLLGSAQDGGMPQAGCRCATCAGARRDPARRRLVACLALIDSRAGASWSASATSRCVSWGLASPSRSRRRYYGTSRARGW